ncbi:hypothetical protein [Nonlabens agnitus]|uniref:DUF3575 domain-containing protein n=1 Tax=Nonlabens agnitus TaxID=870484 RepID=A0A2S9WXB5_9FLAO|nr:hypothetical protein [Nonlabens agnitus]PRP68117.1 hypothetical protein BST86_13980 [Nonlabens agnitus]
MKFKDTVTAVGKSMLSTLVPYEIEKNIEKQFKTFPDVEELSIIEEYEIQLKKLRYRFSESIKSAVIIMLLSIGSLQAQNSIRPQKNEQFLISTHVDPVASIKEKGFNQAFEFEYAGPWIYTKAGIEYFTGLPVTTYFDWHGAIGINVVAGYDELLRFYAGGRIGRIYRGSYGANPFRGFEMGGTIKLSPSFRIGLRGTYDRRNDQKLFNDPVIYRESGYVTLTWMVKNLR